VLEHELLRQTQAGDYDAFEQLYTQLQGPIRRFVRRLIGNAETVDDIVQLTFISLHRNLHRINPVENLRPYLFRIARNHSWDELRKQGRFEPMSLDDEATEVKVSFTSDKQPEPEDTAHWILLHLEVQQAMEYLPEVQRQTLILYSEEEMSYHEIAVAMETNIGTVKSRLFQARKALRRLMRPQTLKALAAELNEEDNL
jgi:RNA polymerase sigma-70 factor, ECF subfamily